MEHKINNGQGKQTGDPALDLESESIIEAQARARLKRTRFLALLKSRYDYTNEKAVDELKRLLTQFDLTNRSLNTHPARSNFKHPLAD